MADTSSAELPAYNANTSTFPAAAPPYYSWIPSSSTSLNLPNNIEIYRPNFPHMLVCTPIGSASTKVRQIAYVSVAVGSGTKGSTPNPAIQLHAGPEATSTVIADVKFNASPSTDLTIYTQPELGGASEAKHFKLDHEGVITSDIHSFVFTTHGEHVEKFEWLHSGAKEVKDLATANVSNENFSQSERGLKLVMATKDGHKNDDSTILAVYSGGTRSHALNPRKIAGKLRFLEENMIVENREEFKLLAVLSVLSMMERGRQHAMKNSEWFCVVS